MPYSEASVTVGQASRAFGQAGRGAGSTESAAESPPSFGQEVDLVHFEGIIGPVAARFFVQAIQNAAHRQAECLIIELDTPGGLDESMRQIIKEIMASEIPVVVYVAPSGSRAASAGAFITLSAHIAVMAPGTNIGAAHPVQIGQEGKPDSTLKEKVTHDAAAYIRTIAEKRGRNVQWAEKAVRQSISATETEALKLKIIDIIAPSVSTLLDSLDGRKVILPSKEKILRTKDATTKKIEMHWYDRILAVIANPNIAYILFMLGILGLYFEFSNPGAILPGVIGGICLILAFFAFQTLPINYAGILLILFAIVLFIADIKAPTHGILTTGGIVSMLLGSIMLFNAPEPFLRVSWSVIIWTVIICAAFFIFCLWMGLKAQGRKVTTGKKGMVGEIGEAKTKIDKQGTVFVAGEHWSATADQTIESGEKIKVVEIDGMTLKVEKA
ncbi:MAG: nodulation protein NfeD [Candidatus Edwardsbacteria bacterium]